MPPGLLLRRATVADAEALAAFGRRVFDDWYRPDNTAEDMELHLSATYGPDRQRAELASPDVTVLLVMDGASIAAYAFLQRGLTVAVVDGPAAAGDFEYLGVPDGARACSVPGFAAYDGKGVRYVDDVQAWPSVEPADDYTATALLAFALAGGQH